jgi:hypothetical protein
MKIEEIIDELCRKFDNAIKFNNKMAVSRHYFDLVEVAKYFSHAIEDSINDTFNSCDSENRKRFICSFQRCFKNKTNISLDFDLND